MSELLIGWSSRDVTPSRSTALRGQFHVRISTHANDPITATALAIEGKEAGKPGDQAILVSCDRVAVDDVILDGVRERSRGRLRGFDPRKLVINATHTHEAPVVQEGQFPPQGPEVMSPAEYAEFLIESASEAVVEAWEKRQPGAISWAYGHAVVGHNRRICYSDGVAKMYGKTDDPEFECVEGYEDHGVDLLFTWDPARWLTGMVVNLACPSQEDENADYISADFWHETRVELRKRFGEDLFVLPQCAAAGDQSPHLLLHKKAEQAMQKRMGLTARQDIGLRIADAAARVLEGARADIRADVPFRHVVESLDLPARRVTEEEYREAKARREEVERTAPGDARAASIRFTRLDWYGRALARYEEQQKSANPVHPVELHVLRLGDVAMATNPFELFLDYGLRMKARSRALQTFIVQLAGNGTYLPTARAVKGRSYGAEPMSNAVGPEGGQVLVNRTVELINSLYPAPA